MSPEAFGGVLSGLSTSFYDLSDEVFKVLFSLGWFGLVLGVFVVVIVLVVWYAYKVNSSHVYSHRNSYKRNFYRR